MPLEYQVFINISLKTNIFKDDRYVFFFSWSLQNVMQIVRYDFEKFKYHNGKEIYVWPN